MPRSSRRTSLLFLGLTAYMLLQFLWWAVLLLRKETEIARLALEVKALGGTTDHPLDASRAMRMIVGEGAVFLLLLLGLLFITLRGIRRDLALARTQRNFLLAVTHELRTPIAAIKLQLQTLRRTTLSAEQRETLQRQALAEADRLGVLADKVLLTTRTEEGAPPLDREELDAMALFRPLVERARAQVAAQHRLELSGPERLLVHSDAQALRSIADNLIENATKYTPAGTRIAVHVQQGPAGWRLRVEDEGPGVPVDERAHLFDRFFRGGAEETRRAKGTGLGLYIVQRLTQRLGGTVHYTQRTPHGAIFDASFPDR